MERVWLYQPDTNAEHPLSSLRLTNTGDTSLPPGIITLYEPSASLGSNNYVGDAELPVLPKGEDRLISFALDSKTKIDREESQDRTLGRITVSQGVMRQAVTNVAETRYTIKAPAEEARTIILESPRRQGWRVVAPDPDTVELTDTHYRVRVEVPAGETKTVDFRLEQDTTQSYALVNLSLNDLNVRLEGLAENETGLRRAFSDMAGMRRDIDALDREIADLDRRVNEIVQDQERLRRNLSSVPQNSDLGRRYLQNMSDQEDQLKELRDDAEEKRADRQEAQQRLQDYIARLSL
jgi:DNA repair exonuclease SbcCD ATPase subunit